MTKIDALSQTLLNFLAFRGIATDTDTAEAVRELVAAFYGRSLNKVQFIKAVRDTTRPTYHHNLKFKDTSINAEVAKLFENVAVPYTEFGTARMSLLEAKVFADIVEINRDGYSDAQVSESLGRIRTGLGWDVDVNLAHAKKAYAVETEIASYTPEDYVDAIADLRFEAPIIATLAPMPPVQVSDYKRARAYLADYRDNEITLDFSTYDEELCILACQACVNRYERENDLAVTRF